MGFETLDEAIQHQHDIEIKVLRGLLNFIVGFNLETKSEIKGQIHSMIDARTEKGADDE